MKDKQYYNISRKGACAEMIASIWLIEQGYQVFKSISPDTPIDIVAIKDDEILRIDVKTYNIKTLSMVTLTEEQVQLNVKQLLVDMEQKKVHGWHKFHIKNKEFNQEHAKEFTQKLKPMVEELRNSGNSYQKIAEILTSRGIKPFKSDKWYSQSVKRILR